MAHKVVDPKLVIETQERIANYEKLIGDAKLFSRRDKDCIETLMRWLETEMENAGGYKDVSLKAGTDDGGRKARFWLGKEQAFVDTLMLFKDPKRVIEIHEREKEVWENQLKELQGYEQR